MMNIADKGSLFFVISNFLIRNCCFFEKYTYLCALSIKPKTMEQLFYELIQVSTKQLDCLSRGPEPEEWAELHDIARQQKMTGICYRGVQALFEFGLRVPQDLVIDWMAEAEAIEERNTLFIQRTIKVQQKLAEKGYQSSVLIGQGTARDYGNELMMLREPEGINIFVDADLNELTAAVAIPEWDETPITLHNTIGLGRNPLRNWRLRKWFDKNRKSLFVKDGEMVRPSASMNVVYLLVCLYWRFLYKGLTMRELTDGFFALKRLADKERASQVKYDKIFRSLGLLHFARGMMWIMHTVFRLDESLQVVKPSAKCGSFILHEVMSGRRHYFRLLLKHPVEMLFALF